MLKSLVFTLSLASFLLLSTAESQARNAELLVSPTRVVFEEGQKFVTVTIRNNGDGVGRYKIDVVDTTMAENGGIKLLEEGVKGEFSAMDNISLSPRSMTLSPDQNQPVRILIKNTGDLQDGEYRSHLQVRMTENDLDLKTGEASKDGATITLKPKMTTVIPIIVRKGKTEYKVTMDEAKLVMGGSDGKQVPEIATSFTFPAIARFWAISRLPTSPQTGKKPRFFSSAVLRFIVALPSAPRLLH